MSELLSRGVFRLMSCPSIEGAAAIVGAKEGEGPLGALFDQVHEDSYLGQDTWEKAESQLQTQAVQTALKKSGHKPDEIGLLFAGDLLNQCIGSSYGLRELQIPFYGLYGACSTMGEGLGLAALFTDSGLIRRAVAVTSSHFCSAERQFRYPLEYGGVRPPSAQWTVTGAGAVVVGPSGKPPYLKGVATGMIQDLGVTDINNMGAAMAPAAADTIRRYLEATQTQPSDYDRIITGDLGAVGSELLLDLLGREQIDLSAQHDDCGLLIFNREEQDVHAGGSGCGCSASVLCAHILNEIQSGRWNEVLFIPTGALMSTVSVQQGESIPGIAHLVHLSSKRWPLPEQE